MSRIITRRGLLRRGALGAGGLLLAGCDPLDLSSPVPAFLRLGEAVAYHTHRLIGADSLAREYEAAEMSPDFRTNGNTMPTSAAYRAEMARGFAGWRLAVDGEVEKPGAYSLAELGNMPSRTQITRHDCVEGWSAIGQWTGVPLAVLLDQVRPKPGARYAVFHCADDFDGTAYYESIDMVDARHKQTILAYAMNGRTLPVGHGAPLRLRVERQLGYKQAKYVMRVEMVADLAAVRGGGGGFWEDTTGYDWYAGV
ncbi:MAG: molybdopterin-binding protein [Geminicoccaceae bacterium]|nr:molybdopterin-binding protein [Geminicoccaceae bacterium]